MEVRDMPKLESPFVRKEIDDKYIVTPEISQGCEWVFEDDSVLATEKLDGTNVSVVLENHVVACIWNRVNRVHLITGDWRINEALVEAAKKGYLNLADGQHFGEVIGPNVNGNPYGLEKHVWIPLETYVKEHLAYKSWHKYPKTYENIRKWFFDPIPDGGIFSLFLRKKGIKAKPEGIVFHHPDGRKAKLRLDMFDLWTGKRHKEG